MFNLNLVTRKKAYISETKQGITWYSILLWKVNSFAAIYSGKCTYWKLFFQALFYNRSTVVKTQSWIKLRNSISSWIFLFVFETLLKDGKGRFRYLQTCINESYMYLSSQPFFKTPYETLKFQEKSKKNAFSSNLQT